MKKIFLILRLFNNYNIFINNINYYFSVIYNNFIYKLIKYIYKENIITKFLTVIRE